MVLPLIFQRAVDTVDLQWVLGIVTFKTYGKKGTHYLKSILGQSLQINQVCIKN
jgi:hypothetical protein